MLASASPWPLTGCLWEVGVLNSPALLVCLMAGVGGGGCSVQRKQISGKEMLQVGQVGIEIEREGAVVGVPTVGFYPTGGQDFQTNLCAQKVQLTLMSCWKKRFYS